MPAKKEKLFGITAWDIALAAVFAAAAIAILVFALHPSDSGGLVNISSGGESIGTFSLSKDTSIPVENGDFVNTVEISDGKVRVVGANCPDQHCVRHAAISYENECIVCLPAKLVVTITDGEEAEVDAFTN